VGLFGDFGAFSTNDSKHMKTGEGGFVICRARKDGRFAALYADKSYDRSASEARDPSLPAINARMSEVNAALGIEQLKRLPGWVERRHRAGARMDAVLSRFPLRPHWRPEQGYASYWWCAFSLHRRRVSAEPAEFARALSAEGVPCRYEIQPYLPGWRLFRRLNRDPRAFRTYSPGTLRKGAYPVNVCPQARRMARAMLAVTVNQHTGELEIRDLETALEKMFECG
jgi:dTDP-4-amino-4,6-dideoxygalactose transaminase